MTPSKSKKALPSPISTLFLERPFTLEQWRTALHRVKILYHQGQLKKCAARCTQLLSEAQTIVRRYSHCSQQHRILISTTASPSARLLPLLLRRPRHGRRSSPHAQPIHGEDVNPSASKIIISSGSIVSSRSRRSSCGRRHYQLRGLSSQ